MEGIGHNPLDRRAEAILSHTLGPSTPEGIVRFRRPTGRLERLVEVRVRHFSVLREQRGTAEETVNVEPGTTVKALYAELFPPGRDGALPVLFAVNRAYVGPQHVLAAGDELAFIPPLGGG